MNEYELEEPVQEEGPLYQEVEEEFEEHEHTNIFDITSKLTGVILRKAEFENDFNKVYTAVFERMSQIRAGDDFLFLLGEVGG